MEDCVDFVFDENLLCRQSSMFSGNRRAAEMLLLASFYPLTSVQSSGYHACMRVAFCSLLKLTVLYALPCIV